jgi:glycosyltransferase involved in cell wall biosynthesis
VSLKLTAIIAARNEGLYIGRCCQHLVAHGIPFAVIDNESTDETRAIVESFRGRGLTCIVNHPYPGFYDWIGLLERKEELARELNSDWFMHLDADEIPEPPQRNESLISEIAVADAAGYTAVNFDEFVFVPTTETERHEGGDYVQSMCHYFFFEPTPQRLIRAWRNAADIELANSGGHCASFVNRRIYPKNFVLRHYITLSMEHLLKKYLGERNYSAAEITKGWHSWRPRLAQELIRVPPAEQLFDIRSDQGWNRSTPHDKHLFLR